MNGLGTLKATIACDTSQFTSGINRASKDLQGLVKQSAKDIRGIDKTFDRLQGFGIGGIAGLAIGGPIAAAALQELDNQLGLTEKLTQDVVGGWKVLTELWKGTNDLWGSRSGMDVNLDEVEKVSKAAKERGIACNDTLAKLEIEKKLLTEGADAAREMAMHRKGFTDGQIHAVSFMEKEVKLIKEQKELTKLKNRVFADLSAKAETAGMNDTDKQLAGLKRQGFDDDDIRRAKDLIDLAKQRADIKVEGERKAREEERKAEKEAMAADKLRTEMQRDAQKIISELRSPEQVMKDELANLRQLKDAGLLNAEQFGKARMRVGGGMDAPQFAGSLERGSFEAQSAIARFKAGEIRDAAIQRQIELEEKQVALLDAINKAIGKKEVDIFGG